MCSAPPLSNDHGTLRATADATAAGLVPESLGPEVALTEEITCDRVLLEERMAAGTSSPQSRLGVTDA